MKSKEGGYGRTGARTPMQWDGSANAGFSTAPAADLYLPVEAAPNVASQRGDDSALLNHVRRMIALRQAHPALWAGADFEAVHAEAGGLPFVYRRSGGGETVLVALNPANKPCQVVLPTDLFSTAPQCLYGETAPFSKTENGWLLSLPPVSGGAYLLT